MKMPYQVAADCSHDMDYVENLVGRIPAWLVDDRVTAGLKPVDVGGRNAWRLTSLAQAIDETPTYNLHGKTENVPASQAKRLAVDMVQHVKDRVLRELTINLRWLVAQLQPMTRRTSVELLSDDLAHLGAEFRRSPPSPDQAAALLLRTKSLLEKAKPNIPNELYGDIKQTVADVGLVAVFLE